MQKRKFDELISHFNRKVSDMSIDQKYKMELLGMISAIGFAHEKELSTNLAEVGMDVPDINVGDINKFIDSLEEIFADIRERHVDDSVCGLCEYDGAYIGQSGDWCNECPGFDRDDCFKLSDKCRKRWIDTITKALPSEQPETTRRIVGKSKGGMTLWYECERCGEPVDEGDKFCRSCGRRFIKNHG